jgi:hypothetical protein
MKLTKEILEDALRYRFLRSPESRDNKNHTQRCLAVEIHDWGKKLGGTGYNGAFWSSLDVVGASMDRAVDAAMKKSRRK